MALPFFSWRSIFIFSGDGEWPVDIEDSTVTFFEGFGKHVDNLMQLINSVYPELRSHVGDDAWLSTRAILTTTNEKVSHINKDVMDLLHDKATIYLSMDSVTDPDKAVMYQPDLLNSQNPPGLPRHSLALKVGVPVMILRNLDPPRLCNGTRAIVTHLYRNSIAVRILNGSARGEIAVIPRIPMKADNCWVQFQRRQLPVSLAFAMTVNKSQGQTLEVVGVDLRESCFAHGQLYVACSRVGRPDCLFLLAPRRKTKNVVYRRALLSPFERP